MLKYLIFAITVIIKSENTSCYNTERLLRLEIANNAREKYLQDYHPNSLLNFTELSQKYGYPSETHTIVTEDGYILKVFRILKRPHCENLKGLPVLLHHGMFLNAISYLDAGPKTGLAYLLADQCLDLWCGNARGTEYSRNHTHLNPDKDPEFWQYSFHEMGLYDLPAMVDYILNKTENKQLRYVGYSQSVSAFLVLTSLRPEYMDKFAVLAGMAPGIWYQPSNSPLIRIGLNIRQVIHDTADYFGVQEVLHVRSLIQEMFHLICQQNVASSFCFEFLFILAGRHENSITDQTLATTFGHMPDGVSLKNIDHIAQMMTSGIFRQYDYEMDNFKMYHQKTPPVCDVKNITTPMFLIYGDNDYLVNSSNVVTLSKVLPNVKRLYRLEVPEWNHLDYVWSKLIPKYLFPKIMDSLNDKIFT